MSLVPFLANGLWSALNVPDWVKFRLALNTPRVCQARRLQRYLRRSAATAFGKAHGIQGAWSYEQFADHVPLSDYDALQPWIDRIRQGERNVLTPGPVTHLVPTSGTTRGRKLIPFTTGLQREFSSAIGAWLTDLFRTLPGLLGGRAYWSVTPATHDYDSADAAVRIGFDSDAAYLGGARERLAGAILAVPAAVQRAHSMEAFRYATLLALLRCRDLRLISIWHPSFLSLLLDDLDAQWENLLKDIQDGTFRYAHEFPADAALRGLRTPLPRRARELRAIGSSCPGAVWPKLCVVSCWGHGPAALAAGALQQRFPKVLVQPKGLIATEAIITLPFQGRYPLAVTSHFFEFLDSNGRAHPIEAVRQDAEYEIVVTTAGGLWRYRLGDRVRVTGFLGRTPCLLFLGRGAGTSDRFGEKLSEPFVTAALQEIFKEDLPAFALLAPDEHSEGCRYSLYVQGAVDPSVAKSLDLALCRNPHYAWCRDLGQLLPVRLFRISSRGYEAYAARVVAQGARLGDVKPAVLSNLTGWSNYFEGSYVEEPNLLISSVVL